MSADISTADPLERRGIVRTIVRFLVRRFYPRMEISHAERIPQTGPVLLCANHANALIDPVLIGIAARRPVRFMAKAPLFEHPILGPPMNALGMIPAFRGSDDARQVKRNLESLDVGAKVLVDGKAMGIFPEGKSTDQAHLEMIRSGTARMALQAVQEGAAGVQVVPVGIIYERKDQFRSAAWIRVAEPIDADALLREHDGDERKARRVLTDTLASRLKDVVIHLNEPDWEPFLDDLESILPPPRSARRKPSAVLGHRQRIAEAMNYFLETDRERAETVAKEIEEFREQVHGAGISVASPVLHRSVLWVILTVLVKLFLLALLVLPAAWGTLYHIIPFVLVRRLAARLDQAGRKTISTNRMLVGVPLYLLWYLLVTVGLLFIEPWLAWLSLAVAPFTGVLAMFYWREVRHTAALLTHQLRVALSPDRQRLREHRAGLRQELEAMAREYAERRGATS